MTIGDFYDCVEGYKAHQVQQAEQSDYLNHLLGHYIAFAVNSPKKYPKEPFLSHRKSKDGFTTDDAIDTYVATLIRKG